MKLLPYMLFEKCIYFLALETASPVNQHCASCIGTLSFPVIVTNNKGSRLPVRVTCDFTHQEPACSVAAYWFFGTLFVR